jgi:hypothetical protein
MRFVSDRYFGVKSLIKFTLFIVSFNFVIISAPAAFTSIHVFGDSLSCTATNPSAGQYYYGKRYSNGRVWVEVLAQEQGLPFDPGSNIHSYFGNTSGNLFAETSAYTPPADASNALVVIWVNNADLYYPALDPLPTTAKFNSVINLALTNQFKAITNLYAKGIRTLIMPNVVDISTIPQFNAYVLYVNLFHQAATNYNAGFYAMLNKARAACPNLTIVVPDYYALLQNLLARPQDYGVVNPLYGLLSIDALDNPLLLDKSFNGPGANYIFWDPTDPTAKVHYIMANVAQQLVSPVEISLLTPFDGIDRLDLNNVPVGQIGFVDSSTNLALANWTLVTNFNSTATTQSLVVIAPPLPPAYVSTGGSGTGVSLDPSNPGTNQVTGINPGFNPGRFYRLRFPVTWTWP